MENDSIRASGTNTLVDIWIEGKLRAICLTKAAIESFVGSNGSLATTEDGRCEFVRTHLPQLVTAVKAELRTTDPDADTVVIDAGKLGGSGDRRKAERRKTKLAPAQLPHGERRRTGRRRSDRSPAPVTKT